MPESFTCHQCHRPQRIGSRQWTKFEPVYSVRPWWGRSRAAGVCLCLYVGIYRRLSANAQRLCGMKVCGGCWNLIERGFDSGSHLTPRSFTRVYVTLKMRRSFIQLHNDLKATESRSSSTTDLVVVCWQTSILLFVTHTLFAFMPFSTHSNRLVFNDRIKALSLSYRSFSFRVSVPWRQGDHICCKGSRHMSSVISHCVKVSSVFALSAFW